MQQGKKRPSLHVIAPIILFLFIITGQTAEAIEKQENPIVRNWNELKQKSDVKRRRLEDSLNLHNLNNSVMSLSCFLTFHRQLDLQSDRQTDWRHRQGDNVVKRYRVDNHNVLLFKNKVINFATNFV